MNHNPYNFPDQHKYIFHRKPVQYIGSSSTHIRQHQSNQNSYSFHNYGNQQPIRGNLSQTGSGKTSSRDSSFQYYETKNPISSAHKNSKNVFSISKNHGSLSTSKLSLNTAKASVGLKYEDLTERKLNKKQSQDKEDLSINLLSLNESIQTLTTKIKTHQERILALQSLTYINNPSKNIFLSKISSQSEKVNQNYLFTSNNQIPKIIVSIVQKIEEEFQQYRLKNAQQLQNMREEIQICLKPTQVERLVNQKISFLKEEEKKNKENLGCLNNLDNSWKQADSSVLEFNKKKSHKHMQEHLMKEIQRVKHSLSEKINLKIEELQTSISKVSDLVHFINNPVCKPSPVKCSGSAILLRFVQNFQVLKPGSKAGEVTITLTDNTYYIDREGYLLDKEQHYLINEFGKQMRLEEKQIQLLKEENILY